MWKTLASGGFVLVLTVLLLFGSVAAIPGVASNLPNAGGGGSLGAAPSENIGISQALSASPGGPVPAIPSYALGAHPTRTVGPDGSCGDCAYYMQEGATIEQACFSGVSGSCTAYAGYSSISADVNVKSSRYATGFELNGYTNTGDWFQSVIGENWCSSGFAVMNEIFDSSGASVYGPTCDPYAFSIAVGDNIELGLYVSSSGSTSGDVCMTASDLTDPQTAYTNCVAQPDGGSSPSSNYFQFGGSNGFFTGPMTEIYDSSASSCLSYLSMPSVTYRFTEGAYVIHFTPWSDQWYPPTNTVCYSTISTSSWTMYPGDAGIQVVDASAASAYGPHWEAAQNISSLTPFMWWATPRSMDLGQVGSVSFFEPIEVEHIDSNPTLSGWSPSASPTLGGCGISSSGQTYTCTPTGSAGSTQIQFVLGESGGYSLSSPDLTFSVYADPQIGSPTISRSTVDVGETLTINASVTGGSGGFTYSWSGLPVGCSPSDSTSIRCSPTEIGWTNVSVMVTDSNRLSAYSGPTEIRIQSDPAVIPYGITPSSGSLDVGQSFGLSTLVSGGSGSYTYLWNGLPLSCSASSTSGAHCVAVTPGIVRVNLSVTDSNGFTASSGLIVFHVYADPVVKASASPSSVLQGDELTLNASVVGGVGPFYYAWSGMPSGCASVNFSVDLAILPCNPQGSGTFNVNVTVKDATGFVSWSIVQITVDPSFLGLPAIEGYGLFLVTPIVAGLAIVLAAVTRRRRRRRQSTSFSGEAPGRTLHSSYPDSGSGPTSPGPWPAGGWGGGSASAAVVSPVRFEEAPAKIEGLDPGSVYAGTPLINPPDPVCWHCTFENPPGSRYCSRCAVPLEPPPPSSGT
jgi:hypothetical protein